MKNKNSLTGKKLLIVNTGSKKKKFIFKKLKEMDLELICLNSEKNWADKYVKDWIIADTYRHDSAMMKVKEYTQEHGKFDGIYTFWEDDVLLTGKLVDELKLTGIPFSVASQARNKFRFRSFCEENGLPSPKHILLKNRDDLNKVKEQLTFPVVLKPAFGSATTMVIKVDSISKLEEEYDYVIRNMSTTTESALNDGMDIFAEEYIDGDEVDIDMIVQNGKIKSSIISDNFDKSRGRYFLDVGQITPSQLPEIQQQKLMDMAELILEKLGILNGTVHFEAKYSSSGPFPIEANLRLGGDYTYSYIKTAWDIDLIELGVKVALNEYIKPIRNIENICYVIGKDLSTEDSGIITVFETKSAFEHPCVVDKMLYKEVGDSIMVPPEGFEFAGWVTVRGESFPDARDNLNKVLEDIELSVSKFDYESYSGNLSTRETSLTKILEARRYLKKYEKINYLKLSQTKDIDFGIITNLSEDKRPLLDSVIKKLVSLGYRVHDINNNVNTLLNKLNELDIDLILPVLDDTKGFSKDLLRLIEVSRIPFIGSGTFVKEILSNRIVARKLLSIHALPFPKWDYVYKEDDEIDEDIELPFTFRGISTFDQRCERISSYKELVPLRKRYLTKKDSAILIEEGIDFTKYVDVILTGDNSNNPTLFAMKSFSTKGKPFTFRNNKLKDLIVELSYNIYYYTYSEDFLFLKFGIDDTNTPYVLDFNADISTIFDSPKFINSFFQNIINSSIYKYQDHIKN